LIEALEGKAKDKGEFNNLLNELREYLSKRID
jgi:hypothetical protein